MNKKNNTALGVKSTKQRISIKAAYDMLPASHQNIVKELLINAIGVGGESANNNVNRIIRGTRPINPAEKKAIEDIFKSYNLNAWNGKYLTKEKAMLPD